MISLWLATAVSMSSSKLLCPSYIGMQMPLFHIQCLKSCYCDSCNKWECQFYLLPIAMFVTQADM